MQKHLVHDILTINKCLNPTTYRGREGRLQDKGIFSSIKKRTKGQNCLHVASRNPFRAIGNGCVYIGEIPSAGVLTRLAQRPMPVNTMTNISHLNRQQARPDQQVLQHSRTLTSKTSRMPPPTQAKENLRIQFPLPAQVLANISQTAPEPVTTAKPAPHIPPPSHPSNRDPDYYNISKPRTYLNIRPAGGQPFPLKKGVKYLASEYRDDVGVGRIKDSTSEGKGEEKEADDEQWDAESSSGLSSLGSTPERPESQKVKAAGRKTENGGERERKGSNRMDEVRSIVGNGRRTEMSRGEQRWRRVGAKK